MNSEKSAREKSTGQRRIVEINFVDPKYVYGCKKQVLGISTKKAIQPNVTQFARIPTHNLYNSHPNQQFIKQSVTQIRFFDVQRCSASILTTANYLPDTKQCPGAKNTAQCQIRECNEYPDIPMMSNNSFWPCPFSCNPRLSCKLQTNSCYHRKLCMYL